MATTDEQADALAALDALGATDTPPEQDKAPAPRRRRSTSGTSRAQRKAKAAGEPTTTKPRAPRAPRAPRRTPTKIADGMASLYTVVGLAVSAIPSPDAVAGKYAGTLSVTQVVGVELTANAESIGAAWEQAARDDPRIREALERLLTVTTFGLILTAHAPVLVAGLVAGGMMPSAVVEAVPAAA